MFYRVDRLFYKDGVETHSMQVFDNYEDARKRYFNLIATDLNDDAITFQMADIISSEGVMLECVSFDRTKTEE